MKTKELFKTYFGSFESALKTLVFLLIPLAAFFSVMSDRTPYNYFNIGVYGILSILIILYVSIYKSFKFDIFTVLVVLFNVAIFASQIINKRLSDYPRTIILLSVFSIIIYQFFINVDNKQLVFKMIMFGGLAFVLFFFFTYREKLLSLDFADRLGEEFSDQNDLSKYLSLFGLISINYSIKAKKFWKIPYIIFALLFVATILITGSISNILCFTICCLIILIINTKRQNRLIAVLIIASAILLIYVVLQFPAMSYFKKRIEEIFNALLKTEGKKDGSAVDRYALFSEALRLFFTRPLFGYGYDRVQYYTHSYGQFSHNNFTELGASFGLFGLITYEILLLMPLLKMIKTKKMDRNLLILTIYLFIFQIFLIIFRKKIEFVMMPLFFSISCFGYYSFIEIGFKNKRINFSIVQSTKEIDEKTIENNQNMRVLCLFDAGFDSINHLKYFYNMMDGVCDVKCIVLNTHDQISSSGVEEFETFVVNKGLLGYRKLSFAIDSFKPDVVYVDGALLNLRLLNCIGFTKKVACYLKENFDENKIFKKKNIEYVVQSNKDKDRLETLSKKKKYHATVIKQEYEDEPLTTHEYLCSFVGAKHLRTKYKEAVELFTDAHKANNEARFSIISDSKSFQQLEAYFKDNKIDYIDLYDEQCSLKNILTSSKSVALLSSSKADSVMMDLYKICGNHIIYKKPEISTINEKDVDAVFGDSDKKQMAEKLLELQGEDLEDKTIDDDDFSNKYYQYQYINLFML